MTVDVTIDDLYVDPAIHRLSPILGKYLTQSNNVVGQVFSGQNTDIADLELSVATLTSDTADNFATVNTSIQTLTDFDTAQASKNTTYDAFVTSASDDIDDLQTDVAARATITSVDNLEASLAGDISAVATRTTTLEADVVKNRSNLVPAQYQMPTEDSTDEYTDMFGDPWPRTSTTIKNPFLPSLDAQVFYFSDPSQTEAQFALCKDYTGHNMVLPAGRYGVRISYRISNCSELLWILRSSSNTWITSSTLTDAGEDVYDGEHSFYFDVDSSTGQEFKTVFRGKRTSDTSNGVAFWLYKFQIVPMDSSETDVPDWINQGLSPEADTRAIVRSTQQALSTGSSSTALLGWSVNTANNEASLQLIAQEGNGTWNGNKILLRSDMVQIGSSTTGARTVISDDLIQIYDSSNVERVRLGVW